MRVSECYLPLMALIGLPLVESERFWTSIRTYHPLDPFDAAVVDQLFERDPLRFTESPSTGPSVSPSIPPSWLPSVPPTHLPTFVPSSSLFPSSSPSQGTTHSPSVAASQLPTATQSGAPSIAPSMEMFPENDPPSEDGDSYFNYNVDRGALWGPGYPELVQFNTTTFRIEYKNNAWGTRVPPDDWYWNEFDESGWGAWAGILANKNPRRNRCEQFGEQSPIDVRDTGDVCEEHHQIRTRRGDFTLHSNGTEAQILSNKLRLKFARRPCRELAQPECQEPDPPLADFPNNWGGYIDAIHVDFKIPSEHLVNGERFDAEMQIFHIHPTRRRTPAVVSLMRASRLGYNPVLQGVIDEFQYVFNDDAAQCAQNTRRKRRRLSRVHRLLGGNVTSRGIDYISWAKFSTAREAPSNATRGRRLEGIFTPYDEKLVTSFYFYAYNGSLTEPPCSEFVTWFVIDTPMDMSFDQLEQLKRIQFNHVDSNCTRTSVHFEESNARPIQDSWGRPVRRCTSEDFLPDALMFGEGNT